MKSVPWPRLAALGVLMLSGIAFAGPLPAVAFAKPSSYESVRLSPDGRHLAISVRAGSQYSLLVLSLPDKKPVSGMRFAGNSTVGSIEWTSNRRLLIAMGYLQPGDDTATPSGELFAMNVDGSGRDYLFGWQGESNFGSRIASRATAERGFAEIEDPLPGDPEHALVTVITSNNTVRTADGRYYSRNFTPVYRMNVNSGKRTLVAEPPMRVPHRYFADARGQVRMVVGVGDDSYESRIYWRIEGGSWQPVPLGGEVEPLRVTRDGTRAYFLVSGKEESRCLMEWTFPTAPSGSTAPKSLFCRPVPELGTVYFSLDDRPYGYGAHTGAAMVLTDTTSAEARVTAALQAQFPGQIVYLADASFDHRKLLFFVYSDHNSGEYYLYDAVTGEASLFDAVQDWLDPEQMSSVRPIRYRARDGLDIQGFLTLPSGRDAKRLPLVVLPHGGPIGVRDIWAWQAEPQFLASRGYAVLQMNYRGSGGYGEAFEKRGFGEWGGKIIDDITDGARWAVAQGIADPARLCIVGASYGGYAALMSAVREPELYRCAVGLSGAYDLKLLVSDSDVSQRQSSRLFWQDSIGRTPEDLTRQSPVSHVSRLKSALMIVHGERDIRTPITQAKALRKALDAAGKPYEWHVEAEEGHSLMNVESLTRYYERLETFLARHIGTP